MQTAPFIQVYGPAVVAFVGLILNALILLKAAVVAAGRRDADVDAMKRWTATHELEAKQRDAAIAQLKEIAASSKATAEGQERRLQMLEDRQIQAGRTHGHN